MSNNLLSEQFPIPCNQGQLETISEKFDPNVQMGLMGQGNNGPLLQHFPMSNAPMGSIGPGISNAASQQISAPNMETRVLNPMSNFPGSSLRPVPYQQSGKIETQSPNLTTQPYFAPCYPSGWTGAVVSNPDSQQVSSKRKLPIDALANGSAVQNLSMPNKRIASMEHRPWLQPMSSTSPRTQYLPALSKRTTQLDSFSSKNGKQSTTKKQFTQKQPSLKAQNETFESVRSKMRESLAAALALVQQRGEPSNEGKNSQVEAASSSGVSPQPVVSASCSFGVDVIVPVAESSAHKGSDEQIMSQLILINSKNDDGEHCDAKESQFINPFPREDVQFSENIFSRDDLLQGNGLSWVLDPELQLEEKKKSETTEALDSDDAKMGRINKKSLQDPQILAFKIEAELFKLFGGVNKKYKEKGRSLLFNLKDKNNPELREKVMYGGIPPERLCSMSAEELASKELSEWRQAKAEEMAQMVVLPETEVDIRRLVRKTHKGEFQVEVEPVDSGSVEVSVGSSSLSWYRSETKDKDSPPTTKAVGKKNQENDSSEKNISDQKVQLTSRTVTIPSNEGTDPMQGVTVDDDMKDATESLPPIVSLDEFMKSLDSEPPFSNVPERNETEASYNLKSPEQTSSDSNGKLPAESEKTDVRFSKPDAHVKSSTSGGKTETNSVVAPTEHVWEGLFQLSVSSVASVIGIFKSGEKTSAREWPLSLEIKGRVKLDAFEKFLQDLPKSKSRAVMVIYFVSKEGSPKSERSRLSEESESYVTDSRVGFAEPTSGVELYLCPPQGKTPDLLGKIVPKDQLNFFESLNDGLIGIVVWRRRPQVTSTVLSPNSASHHKHGSIKQHSNYQKQDSSMYVNVTSTRSTTMSHHRDPSPDNRNDHNDGDDDGDVPPGFGPGFARDDDDLPEFNFSSGGHFAAQSHSVDQVRELIHKYGKPKPAGGFAAGTTQPWNNDDDDDDIPEWQPQAQPNSLLQTTSHLVHNYQTQTVNPVYSGSVVRPATLLQPQQNLPQQGGWWTHQPGGGQYHGTAPGFSGTQSRTRRF